jgi:hypothetical protein
MLFNSVPTVLLHGTAMRLPALIGLVLCATAMVSSAYAQDSTLGRPCGGPGGAECSKGQWCEPVAGACNSQRGTCVAVPRLCISRKKTKSFQPVCGCNDKTYSNDCFRRAYRIPKAHDGKC